MIDDELRALAQEHREQVSNSLDVPADLAAVRRRVDAGAGLGPVTSDSGRGERRRVRLRWSLAAASVVVVVALVGVRAVINTDEPAAREGGNDDLGVEAPPASVSPQTSNVATSAPGESFTEVTWKTMTVDVLSPPALVVPTALAVIPRASGHRYNLPAVAIGEAHIAVTQPGTQTVTLIEYDPETGAFVSERNVGIDEPLYAIVLGPDLVLYGMSEILADNPDGDVPPMRLVAIPLAGDLAGKVVAERELSWVGYIELERGAFGLGRDGVIDRVRQVGETVMPYVDQSGEPGADFEIAAPLATWGQPTEEGVTVTVAELGLAWQLIVRRAPGQADWGLYPPTPTTGGRFIYTVSIGERLVPADVPFGPNAMPVVAFLDPQGPGSWLRLPDEWAVAASDVWGTALLNVTEESFSIALLERSVPAEAEDSGTSSEPICTGGLDGREAAERFTEALVLARDTGEFSAVSDCLDDVPDVYTGDLPACWTVCEGDNRMIETTFAIHNLTGNASGVSGWLTQLPVSYVAYDGTSVDVIEAWRFLPGDDRHRVDGFEIWPAIIERAPSLEVVTRYFDHIADGNWRAAATLLDDGGASWEQRADLADLDLDWNAATLGDLADALEQWCRDGCDTDPPSADDLVFTGRSYDITRNGRRISVTWWEGSYYVVGLPFPR